MNILKNIVSKELNIPIESVGLSLAKKMTPSWDSLTEIILMTEIENAFHVKFGYDEAMAVKSVADIVDLLQSKGIELNM